MKLDRTIIDELLAMDDDRLWQAVRGFAATKKIHLSEETPPKETMTRLRGIFTGTEKYDLASAVKILSNYRTRRK